MTTTKTTPKKSSAKKPTPTAYKTTCDLCGKSYWTTPEMQKLIIENGYDDYGLCDECAESADTNYIADERNTTYEPICYREPNDYDGN